jgi:hypothetical protein
VGEVAAAHPDVLPAADYRQRKVKPDNVVWTRAARAISLSNSDTQCSNSSEAWSRTLARSRSPQILTPHSVNRRSDSAPDTRAAITAARTRRSSPHCSASSGPQASPVRKSTTISWRTLATKRRSDSDVPLIGLSRPGAGPALAGDAARDTSFATAGGPQFRDALDRCLSCKACSTDRPVGIDMATYKAEFLHHHRGRLRPRSDSRSAGTMPTFAPRRALRPVLRTTPEHPAGVPCTPFVWQSRRIRRLP